MAGGDRSGYGSGHNYHSSGHNYHNGIASVLDTIKKLRPLINKLPNKELTQSLEQSINFLQGELMLADKGFDVRSLEEAQRSDIYCLVEFIKQKKELESKAKEGKLDLKERELLNQAVILHEKGKNSIESILEDNEKNANLDDLDL